MCFVLLTHEASQNGSFLTPSNTDSVCVEPRNTTVSRTENHLWPFFFFPVQLHLLWKTAALLVHFALDLLANRSPEPNICAVWV